MIDISIEAKNQIMGIVSQFCDYKTPQEYGRSAFWLWFDMVKSEIYSINAKSSKKISSDEYCYIMKYWGKIYFRVQHIRIRNRFAGVVYTITKFAFDDVNFYNWLQHIAPVEYKASSPNIINPQFKPRPIGFGYQMVKSRDGLFTITDSNGQIIVKEWFNDIKPVKKTNKGELAALVNKRGWAYIFYLTRTNNNLQPTGKSWASMVTEMLFHRAFKDSINEIYIKKGLNESTNNVININENDLRTLIYGTLKRLYESEYKPIAYNSSFKLANGGGERESLVTLSDGAGRFDIGEDDGCYVIYQDKLDNTEPYYIFPELHKALKKLPNLPLR